MDLARLLGKHALPAALPVPLGAAGLGSALGLLRDIGCCSLDTAS